MRGTRRKPDRVWMGARRAPRTRYVPAMLLSDRINGRLVSPDIRRVQKQTLAGQGNETSRKVGGSSRDRFSCLPWHRCWAAMLSQRYSWNFLFGGYVTTKRSLRYTYVISLTKQLDNIDELSLKSLSVENYRSDHWIIRGFA